MERALLSELYSRCCCRQIRDVNNDVNIDNDNFDNIDDGNNYDQEMMIFQTVLLGKPFMNEKPYFLPFKLVS